MKFITSILTDLYGCEWYIVMGKMLFDMVDLLWKTWKYYIFDFRF